MPQTFLSTLSLRRATVYDSKQMHRLLISIHTLLAESDLLQSGKMSQQQLFLSTLSLRRATRVVLYIRVSTDISIHALLAESDAAGSATAAKSSISIHALLAESDNGLSRIWPTL